MLKMTIVVMPEARKPLICEVVKPLALPMPPLQKIIAVAAADTREEPASNGSKTNAATARQDKFRVNQGPMIIAFPAIESPVAIGLADFIDGNKRHDMLLRSLFVVVKNSTRRFVEWFMVVTKPFPPSRS
jgi:hypothetical protein